MDTIISTKCGDSCLLGAVKMHKVSEHLHNGEKVRLPKQMLTTRLGSMQIYIEKNSP